MSVPVFRHMFYLYIYFVFIKKVSLCRFYFFFYSFFFNSDRLQCWAVSNLHISLLQYPLSFYVFMTAHLSIYTDLDLCLLIVTTSPVSNGNGRYTLWLLGLQKSQRSAKSSQNVEDDKEGHLLCRTGDRILERCTDSSSVKSLSLLLSQAVPSFSPYCRTTGWTDRHRESPLHSMFETDHSLHYFAELLLLSRYIGYLMQWL